ncbi:MAG: DUF5671 domain-containing protein [Chloroflexota bacterium]
MTTIRRIYAYLLAFAGLAMFSTAAAHLVQLLVDVVLQSPMAAVDPYVRDTASLFAAAALVGLPVWLLHWLWIGRSVRANPEERASTLRHLYLTAVLVGATFEMAGSARDALLSACSWIVGLPTQDATLDAIVRPLPFTSIALCVWLGHWRVTARDRARVGEPGGPARLRRWYLYGSAWLGLVLLLTGTSGVLESVWRMVTGAGGPAGPAVVQPAADALVGLGLWLAHWVVLPARLSEAEQRTDDTSVLRSVYLFLTLALAIIGSLLGLSQLLYYAVGRLIGVDHPGGVGGDLQQAAAGPASIALVYAAAWAATRAYQRPVMLSEAAGAGLRPRQTSTMAHGTSLPGSVGETARQAGVRRLYMYLVALVALGVLASGVAGLLWTLGDVFFPASAMTDGQDWREQLALYATLTVVGLPVWLLHWRATPADDAEAGSLARRLYVYLALIMAMLALVGSAAAVLYRLLGLALGASFGVSVAADFVHALAVACVAAVLATYHWRVVRADSHRLQARTAATVEHSETALPAGLLLQVHAADHAILDTAITSLRAAGVQVTIVHHPQPAIPGESLGR